MLVECCSGTRSTRRLVQCGDGATWHSSEVSDTVQQPAPLGSNTVRHTWAVQRPTLNVQRSTLTRTRIHPHSHTPRETCRPGRPARIIPGLWSPLGLQKWVCVPKYRLPISPAQVLPVRSRCRTRVCTATRRLRAPRLVAVVRSMYGVPRRRLIGCPACKAVPHAPCSLYELPMCDHGKRSEKKQRKKPLRFQPWSRTHLQQNPLAPPY